MSHCQLTIEYPDRDPMKISIRRGLGMQAVCAQHPTCIDFDCRHADCGICIIKVRAGSENISPPTPEEADFLKAMRAESDERLACQMRVMGDAKVFVEFPMKAHAEDASKK